MNKLGDTDIQNVNTNSSPLSAWMLIVSDWLAGMRAPVSLDAVAAVTSHTCANKSVRKLPEHELIVGHQRSSLRIFSKDYTLLSLQMPSGTALVITSIMYAKNTFNGLII